MGKEQISKTVVKAGMPANEELKEKEIVEVETTNVDSENQEVTKTVVKESESENVLYMDSYTTCKNICNWDIYFSLTDGGDKTIKANGTLDLLNRDIVSLCSNNNIFFSGEDGMGNHARIKIMNDLLRKHVGFDSEDNSKKQIILDNETLKSIFSSKNQKEFEEKVKKSIVAFHEKDIIIKYAKQIRENDYNRISFLEGYTGKDFRNQ